MAQGQLTGRMNTPIISAGNHPSDTRRTVREVLIRIGRAMLETCGSSRGRVLPSVPLKVNTSAAPAFRSGSGSYADADGNQERPRDASSRKVATERDRARSPGEMFAAALEAKVAAYIRDHTDQLDEDGRRLMVRNGATTAGRS